MLLFLTIGICNSVLAEVTKTIFDYSGKGGDGSICLWYDITLTFDRPIIGQFTSTRATGANVGIYSENIKSDEIITIVR